MQAVRMHDAVSMIMKRFTVPPSMPANLSEIRASRPHAQGRELSLLHLLQLLKFRRCLLSLLLP